jgi:hypothetical protein
MDTTSNGNSPNTTNKDIDLPRLAGCCSGQALGCGFSFLISWVVALIVSSLLAPVFGKAGGGNTIVGILISALTCVGSLVIGTGLSFLVGRIFPIFKKKAR